MVHRHVFYFCSLENIVAFCFVQDVFQVVNDVVAYVLVSITFKAIVVVMRFKRSEFIPLLTLATVLSVLHIVITTFNLNSVLRQT